MASLRAWHAYLAVLIAPSVIFFALTGALQIFDLHETHGAYRAPLLLQSLGRLHKDQIFAPQPQHEPPGPAPGAQPAGAPAPPPAADDDDRWSVSAWLLKVYFSGVALGLITATCMGLWIALTHPTRKRLSWILLAAGVLAPLAMLLA